ncbi:MAG: hypothetical protein ACREQW_24825 [Candidatus Binatia bacterium]
MDSSALCGLGIIAYGIFLFFAMPAAGIFVAMTGLVLVNIGLRKTDVVNRRLTALTKDSLKNKQRRDLDQLGQPPDNIGKKIPIPKSYKIVASLLFVTNLFLISTLAPKFSSLGGEVGFVLSGGVRILAALFYTWLILSVFRTTNSLAVVLMVTWGAIVLRAVK